MGRALSAPLPVGMDREPWRDAASDSVEPSVTANDNQPRTPEDPGRRGNVAALIAVLVISLALFWVVSAIRRHDDVQNCIDSGRHDCVETGDASP